MKKKYKFTYKDGKEIEIEANKKFVRAHESGGCDTHEAYISCIGCPLYFVMCPTKGSNPRTIFKNTKLEEIEMKKKSYTFIEAVNSGKRFRHVDWSESINGSGWYKWNGGLVFTEIGNVKISKKYLNQQYVLEEKTITITESQFDDAWLKGFNFNEIKKELGF